jgi:hypothetical protein
MSEHAVIVERAPHTAKPCYGQCHDAVQQAVRRRPAPQMLDLERLTRALMEAEIGCIGFGGFHDGNDAESHHRRDAEAIIRRYGKAQP